MTTKPKQKSRTSYLSKEDRVRYKTWYQAVYTRDGFRCQVCLATGEVTPHHIKTWKKWPDLRFSPDNGITLCKECHYLTYKREEEYEQTFFDLLDVNYDILPPAPPSTKSGIKPTERVCCRCDTCKPIEEFARNKKNRWGVTHMCLLCFRADVRGYQESNKQEHKESVSAWFKNNRKYRADYVLRLRFKKEVESGVEPKWTKRRAELGLVPLEGPMMSRYNKSN